MKASRLRELIFSSSVDTRDQQKSKVDLIIYLVNNAEAIAELIEAAEMVSHTTTDSKASGYLAEALAKIKE